MGAHILSLHTALTFGVGSKVNIFFPKVVMLLSRKNIVDRLLTLFCMIPKVNLRVGEMGFMFCDL